MNLGPHKLHDNKTSQRPRNIVCLSIASKTRRGKDQITDYSFATVSVLALSRDPRYPAREPDALTFSDSNQFWSWLDSRVRARERTTIFAYRLLYSFSVLGGWSALPARGWEPTGVLMSESFGLTEWKRGTSNLRFLDITNFVRDYRETSNHSEQTVGRLYATIDDYLRFLDEHELGTFAVSLAGQAFNAYRHRHMHRPIYIHTDENAIALERDAYHGGRNECYHLGTLTNGPYTLLDVNAMYGAVMRDGLFPYRLREVHSAVPLAYLARQFSHSIAIADVDIETDRPMVPCRVSGINCYPIGRFRTALAGEELELAASEGIIRKVHRLNTYDRTNLFSSYAEYWHQWRWVYQDAGDVKEAGFCKLMSNALYGKWGQRGKRWEKVGECDADRLEYRICSHADGTVTHERSMLGWTWESHDTGNSINAMVAIAACITASARVRLWRIMMKAGEENVVYCDTDSVIVRPVGLRALAGDCAARSLGALKVVDQGETVTIRGLKNYEIGETRRRKGLPGNAIQEASSLYRYELGESLEQMLHAGSLEGYHSRTTRAIVSSRYGKGQLWSDGSITPFLLPFEPPAVPPQFQPPHPGWLVGRA